MELSVWDQLRQLTAALVTGGIIGLFFDLTRLSGSLEKVLRALCAAASAVLVFIVGRASGSGLRLFFLLATAGGICLYLWALHPMICADLTVVKQFLQYYAGFKHENTANHVKKT